MATAFLFITLMAVVFPLVVAVVNAFNMFINYLATLAGFNLMFDVLEVLDCCLPFSLISVIFQLSAIFSIVVSFVLARKLVTMLLNVFGLGVVK